MLKRTMTLAHEPVESPNYHFTDAEVFAMADAEDRASVKTEDRAKADAEDRASVKTEDRAKAEVESKGQDALRSIFQGIRHLPAVLPRTPAVEDARNRLKQAEADFAMANEEVLRAHKMNGPNVEYHVQSALTYREDSRRRLAAAEVAARQAQDATSGCGCGRSCELFETCGGGEGPPPTD
jgi:hypothetical protein